MIGVLRFFMIFLAILITELRASEIIKIPENIEKFARIMNENYPENLGFIMLEEYKFLVDFTFLHKKYINSFFDDYLKQVNAAAQRGGPLYSIFEMKDIIYSVVFNQETTPHYQKLFAPIILCDFIKTNKKTGEKIFNRSALTLLINLLWEDNNTIPFCVNYLYMKSYQIIFENRKKNGDIFDAHYYLAKINSGNVDDLGDIAEINKVLTDHQCIYKITNNLYLKKIIDYTDSIGKKNIINLDGIIKQISEKLDKVESNKNSLPPKKHNKQPFLGGIITLSIIGFLIYGLYWFNQPKRV